jgi:hypothetical protein
MRTELKRLAGFLRTGNLADGQAGRVDSDAVQLVFRAPLERVTDVFADIYRVAPYSQPSAMGVDPDSGEHIAMINGYIRLGLLVGSLMAFMALAVALTDRVNDGRRADHELLAAGAPAMLIRRVHTWEVGLSVTAGLAVAAGAGIAGGLAWQLAGGLNRAPDWTSILTLLFVAGAASAVVTAVAACAAPKGLNLVVLRSE